MNFPFSVITGPQAAQVIENNYAAIVKLIEETYLLHSEQQTVNPPSYFLRFPQKPDARIIALPAYVGGDINVSGIKWIASNPHNVAQGFPRASAVLILNDYATGYPFACIEAAIISATRTAASAALALEHINKPEKRIKNLAVIGAGPIAMRTVNILHAINWSIDKVGIFDLEEKYSHKFSEKLQAKYGLSTQVYKNIESLLVESDVIIFATSALKPYLTDTALFNHAPTILNISLRDLSPTILEKSNNIVDDIEHVLKANTSPHLTYQLCGHKDFINGTISQLIQNDCILNKNTPTIFSPMGMGILDLAIGKYIYDQVAASSNAHIIPDFFCELER